jgi:integrase
VRRSLLVIDHLLSGGEVGSIPLVFPKKQRMEFPSWAQAVASEFLAVRKRSGKCDSTLDMDRSALARFLSFADNQGCRGFGGITVEVIKGFNLQDRHTTNEGKNAYNTKIRGFLRFLESRGMVPNGISKVLPTVNVVKLRPAVILGADDLERIDNYCVNAEHAGKWLESAVLKIATQTGLRGTDISRLRCDSIDWHNREFSLIQRKTRRHIRLPFSNGVGNSMLKYIEEERPRIQTPFLFISPRAPHGCLSKGQVNLIVSRALGRRVGVHILRKTFASGLLRAEVGYDAVADVLGHESPQTVDPYLSMDSQRMRACAIPLGDGLQYKGVSL